MTETKKLWSEEDELAYLAGDMNGILYEDENRGVVSLEVVKRPLRQLATEKSILQVKALTNNKIDSWDRPDVLPPAEPFYIERYEDKKVLKYKE